VFRLAWRQLLIDPLRTCLTAFALRAVIATILVLEGFEQGQYFQLARAVFDRDADLIVTQAGVSNFLATRSSIPQLSRADVESVEGVVNAHPITVLPVIYEKLGRKTPLFLFVYDTRGGAVNIIEGQNISDGRDIIVDVSLAKRYDIQIGDKFIVSDFEFKVAGITEDAAALFTGFAFINYDGMIDLFLESEIAPDLSTFPLLSFMLVELEPTADRVKVASEIEARAPDVDVYTPQQLAENDVNLGRTLFGPVMNLLVNVAYIIGLLVVGLIMFANVRSRLRSFAVLKALGFSNTNLAFAVLLQALLLLIISLPLGVLLAQGIAMIIHLYTPLYLIYMFEPDVFIHTLSASIIFAIIGSWIPLRSIRKADPMLAFQGT